MPKAILCRPRCSPTKYNANRIIVLQKNLFLLDILVIRKTALRMSAVYDKDERYKDKKMLKNEWHQKDAAK